MRARGRRPGALGPGLLAAALALAAAGAGEPAATAPAGAPARDLAGVWDVGVRRRVTGTGAPPRERATWWRLEVRASAPAAARREPDAPDEAGGPGPGAPGETALEVELVALRHRLVAAGRTHALDTSRGEASGWPYVDALAPAVGGRAPAALDPAGGLRVDAGPWRARALAPLDDDARSRVASSIEHELGDAALAAALAWLAWPRPGDGDAPGAPVTWPLEGELPPGVRLDLAARARRAARPAGEAEVETAAAEVTAPFGEGPLAGEATVRVAATAGRVRRDDDGRVREGAWGPARVAVALRHAAAPAPLEYAVELEVRVRRVAPAERAGPLPRWGAPAPPAAGAPGR